MKAVVTSIGEPTTDLCIWALERLGYQVLLYKGEDSLAHKLQYIYQDLDEDFLRVDADVVPNRNVLKLPDYNRKAWWIQGLCYGWYSQDLIHGGAQFIRREALPALRANIKRFEKADRPESQMYRLDEFHSPRRCLSSDIVCGVHGWGQNDLERVKQVKAQRGQSQNYDWELVERMV